MPTDLEVILERIRAQVDERRRAGTYPPGLEEDLESELARIVARRPLLDPIRPIGDALEGLARIPGVDPGRVAAATQSGIPGGAVLHGVVAKVVGHQVGAILSQVQDVSNVVWEDLCMLADTVTKLADHIGDRRDLWALLDSLVDRMAALERSGSGPGGGSADLVRRLERLEAAEAARTARPWFSADLDVGAGDPTAETGLLVEDLEDAEPVLVVGPGADDALGLLHKVGVEATGEADRDLVIAVLGSTPDRSLGALVAVDLVERLAPQQLLDLVRLAADKLRPGGRLVANATNPRCLWGLAHGVGGRPDRALVDPGWLALCAREAGFASAEIVWGPRPSGGGAQAGEGTEALVHQALFQPVSYRLNARR